MTQTVAVQGTDDDTLPQSWEWAQVEQLGDVVTGNTPSTKERQYYGGSVPLFKPTDLNAGYWVSKSETTLTKAGAEKARVLPAKSILVTCIGATIGKTGLSQSEGATNQQINALVPSKEHLVPEYLYFGFVSRSLQDQILSNASSTTLPILNKSKFGRLEIPLPPLNEQRRIVEKIEELFTKLDAGVRSLEQAREQLKSYRRPVLKAAVEGELSREWREAHRDELEPASELLDRILQERREKSTGKKYKEPAAPDIAGLLELPEAWCWTSLSAIADTQLGKMLSQAAKTGSGTRPYLRNQNIRWESINTGDVLTMDFDEREVAKFSLLRGDVLVCEGGEPGRAAVWNEQLPGAMYQKALHRVRIISSALAPEYLVYHLRKDASNGSLESYFTGSTIKHFTGVALSRYAVSLPPLEEQRFIVEEVERRLSVVDKLEATVEANLKQAAGLRQSILKQAFSGGLVSQDPDDEPASVLLARIRSEREDTKQKAKRPRKVSEDDEAQGRLI